MNETAEAATTTIIANRSTKRHYFELTFDELAFLEGSVCTFALTQDQKLTLQGRFSIDRHHGSHTYNDQVVLSVWGRVPPVLSKRPPNRGFYRMELPLAIPAAIKLFQVALRRLTEA